MLVNVGLGLPRLGLCWHTLACVSPMLPYVGYLRPMLEICSAIFVHKHRPRQLFWLCPSLQTENTPSPRRPAVRRKPLKSGPRARVLAGGLRLVTERYIRSRPLPPTLLLDRAYTPCRPPPDLRLNPVDRFICILRRMFKKCSKTSFFYSVSWPPADMTFA